MEIRSLTQLSSRNFKQFLNWKITNFLPLSAKPHLKTNRSVIYFRMDFRNWTMTGLIDTGAQTKAISEADLCKNHLLAQPNFSNGEPPWKFRLLAANGLLRKPSATIILHRDVENILFYELSVVFQQANWLDCFTYDETAPIQTCVREYSITFFFHATQNCRHNMFWCHRTLTKPNRYSHKTGQTNR